MEEAARNKKLAETIRRLYGIVGELERDYRDQHRHFTLDGHLIGSIGEVYAAEGTVHIVDETGACIVGGQIRKSKRMAYGIDPSQYDAIGWC